MNWSCWTGQAGKAAGSVTGGRGEVRFSLKWSRADRSHLQSCWLFICILLGIFGKFLQSKSTCTVAVFVTVTWKYQDTFLLVLNLWFCGKRQHEVDWWHLRVPTTYLWCKTTAVRSNLTGVYAPANSLTQPMLLLLTFPLRPLKNSFSVFLLSPATTDSKWRSSVLIYGLNENSQTDVQ